MSNTKRTAWSNRIRVRNLILGTGNGSCKETNGAYMAVHNGKKTAATRCSAAHTWFDPYPHAVMTLPHKVKALAANIRAMGKIKASYPVTRYAFNSENPLLTCLD